jgi:hypothetical protein
MGRILWMVGVLMLLVGSSRAVAADKETRNFNITIDGKQAGSYSMKITKEDDGNLKMVGSANVKVRIAVLFTYKYSYQGTEVWKDGRLTKLTSTSNDDGKGYEVSAWADGNVVRLLTNGAEKAVAWDVWTTTYWQLPGAKYRNGSIPLLDADTGRGIDGTMKRVGTEALVISQRRQNCEHYKVTGDNIDVDVWYDAQERLVRQESVEDGHRSVLTLTSIER